MGDVGSVKPSSVDWVRVDPTNFVAGYVNAACVIYDVETGKQVVKLDTFQVSGIAKLAPNKYYSSQSWRFESIYL